MSARVVSQVEFSTGVFSGWRCRVEAGNSSNAEELAGALGLVADIVSAGDGQFEVLVVDCISDKGISDTGHDC